MRTHRAAIVLSSVFLLGCCNGGQQPAATTGGGAPPPTAAPAGPGPAALARAPAERLEIAGVENAARVAPGVYRGAQPTAEGFKNLKETLGVKTVVNLRHYHDEHESAGELGLEVHELVLESSDAPSEEQVVKFLEIVTDPARQPVYFHCMRGKDRTGTMCAVYRMEVDGWSNDEAYAEMQSFGFAENFWFDLKKFVRGYKAHLERFRRKTAG